LTVTADDQHGGHTSQRFTLTVLPNAPPVITSPAVTSVDLGQTYTYDVNADDPNPGDTATLVYSLDQASLDRGMTVVSSTGVITGATPALGIYPVTVTVADQAGATDVQSYDLRVRDPNSNTPPVIHSQIRDHLQVGQQLVHQVD